MRDPNRTPLKRTLAASTAAFALGGLTMGGVGFAVAQDRGQDRGEPQRADIERGYVQQLSFADLVEDVSPAVVSIRTTRTLDARESGLPPELERMLPPQLRDQFGGRGAEPREAVGEGSGFFIDADGHIVTNNHVIEGATEIVVTLNDGDELIAELVGTDPATDIAVLRVEPSSDQRYVQFSPNADLRVGDYVLAVGNPFGLGGSVTSGIVSAIGGDRARSGQYADFIQIDASINRGNSGGPTFDLRGNVVGVNTAIISPTGGNVGIGLAVPADTAAEVTGQLIENGSVSRGWLGVSIRDVDDSLAQALGLDGTQGALVAPDGVQPGSPAARAGIEDGDVILRFGEAEVGDATALTRAVGRTAPGERVRVRLLRDGERRTVTVRLTERDSEDRVASAFGTQMPEGEAEEAGGVTLSRLDERTRERLRIDPGVDGVVIVDVEQGSEAAEAGLRSGMVITEAEGRAVRSVRDVERALDMARERGKGAVLVRVVTSQGSDFRALPVEDE